MRALTASWRRMVLIALQTDAGDAFDVDPDATLVVTSPPHNDDDHSVPAAGN